MTPTVDPDPGSAGGTSLRERKKQQTRARIHTVALQLAADKGLDAVTVDEIAAEADVSTRTFFNYFPGKDQAIVGFDVSLGERFAAAIREAPADMGPLDLLEHTITAVVLPDMSGELKQLRSRVVEQNPRLLPAVFGAGRDLDTTVREALAQRLGLPSDDLYAQLLVNVGTAVIRSALQCHKVGGADTKAAAHTAFGYLRDGLDRVPQA